MFGHDSTPAAIEILPRSRRWRTLRAARNLAAGVLLAPVVGMIPPHAPWAIGAVAGALFLARRTLLERLSLLSLEGTCPRCREEIRVRGPTRLRRPHPVACETCHHQAALHVENGDTTSSLLGHRAKDG